MSEPRPIRMSGLTEAQVRLLELRGALQVVTWLVREAFHANANADGGPEVPTYLERLALGLARAEDFCRIHGWRPGGAE